MNSIHGRITLFRVRKLLLAGIDADRADQSARPQPLNDETHESRTVDLYSRASDGTLMLWKHAMQVVPATTFERNGCWIRSGHYVIIHKGDAIIVHCGNAGDGSVSVQYAREDLTPSVFPRITIESMLLGKVVASEETQAAVCEGSRLSNLFADECRTGVSPWGPKQ